MPVKKKICIVSQSHLCRNPRMLKEALVLSGMGYLVTILTAIHAESFLEEDRHLLEGTGISYEFYSDLREANLTAIWQRMLRKAATEVQAMFRIESIFSLGYNVRGLIKNCLARKADLYIMHQEMPTCIGPAIIKKGYKVAFDLEDWYSADLLPIVQNRRPLSLLKKSESVALNKGVFCVTTSNVMAQRLAQTYATKLPETVYNVFPVQLHLLQKNKEFALPLKLFWFSQTIGPGRGLEEFISILNSIDQKLELHLLGNIDASFKEKLNMLMPAQHHLYFHEWVNGQELPGKIAQFDIGLALELTSPPSRNYTITNKFFQYLQSGLPIIASETAGQNEVFDLFKPGFKLPQTPKTEDIQNLKKWLNDPSALKAARAKAIQAAETYNWENESDKLIGLVKNALQSN